VTSRRSALRYCPLHLQLAHLGHPFFAYASAQRISDHLLTRSGPAARYKTAWTCLQSIWAAGRLGGPNWTSLLLHTALYARFFACKAISCPSCPAAVQQLCNSCSTWCQCVFQHTLLWKPLGFFSYTSVVMIPSILQAHKLWGAFLLHKQALSVCSDNLKTKVSIAARNLYTALIIPSYAHNLCGHATQQPAILARSSECIVAEKHVS